MTHRFARMTALSLTAALLAASVTPAFADDGADNKRREWYQSYDTNGDKRLKGKEAKNFMKDHEKVHAQLMEWCEDAIAKPKKHDVKFPKDEKEKKFKCKKKRFDKPYIQAWVREKDAPKDDGKDEMLQKKEELSGIKSTD